ncbi:hypothetical protein JI744_15925 [Tabrizicola sp. KVB23]|uniref:Tat pathway signal sequence domain protein n=1 Tax=Fuscibacter oryzae TaxID=2803939 RepID=A0A8J7MZ90_9RHOB|nr:hypothetical protein [Fuscibacter oryzae]
MAAGSALAQSGNFEIELNSAADVEGACRLTFVATNNTNTALTEAAYEVAAFDAAGVVSQLLVLEFGALPTAKTRVVQFDLPGTKCAAISRLLVNGQNTCQAADGPKDICLKSLSASSRISTMPFGL